MAYTSVKISADSSSYQSQMKSAASQMKVLSAEYTTAATKAKLFGSETDSLKAKAESLTQKITVLIVFYVISCTGGSLGLCIPSTRFPALSTVL